VILTLIYRWLVRYCLNHFEVMIWTSAMLRNIEDSARPLLGANLDRLVAFWDQSQCVADGKHPTSPNKPLLTKPLTKVWSMFPAFSARNTVVLDDDPLKLRCNPAGTSFHPDPWECHQTSDSALHASGSIRTYLERIRDTDDTQAFILCNPFLYSKAALATLPPSSV